MQRDELISYNMKFFRMTSLLSSLASFESYLRSSGKTSVLSAEEFLVEEVTLASLSLMTEVVQNWQYAAHLSLSRKEFTSLAILNDLLRTCLVKLQNDGPLGPPIGLEE